jgi:hypothetical protein
LPIVLLRAHLGELTGWRLPAVVLAGLAGVVLYAWKSPKTSDSLEVASYLSATGVLAMSVLLWCVCRGTPIVSLLDGLFFQHGRFMERFYHDMPVPAWTPVWCLAAIGLGIAAWRGSTAAVRVGQVVAVGLALYVGLQHLLETSMPFEHGLVDRGGARLIMGLFAPLSWLLVLGGSDRRRGARLLLALVAVLQPLAIYPTPGTQLAIGALPLLVCLLVVLHDIAASPVFATDGFTPCVRVAIAGLAMLLGVSIVARGVTLAQQRADHVSLGLPGAERLGLPAAEVARWRWAVQKVREHGDTFIGLHHGQCSIYLWAGLEPPRTFTAPMWSHLLNEQQQRDTIGALRQQPYSCVFYNRRSTSKYDPDAPLVQYLLANYEPAEKREGMEVWRRKETSVP